jgi:hypothetical protein
MDGEDAVGRGIERLFHATDSMIWDLVDANTTHSPDARPIYDAAGRIDIYAQPAADRRASNTAPPSRW